MKKSELKRIIKEEIQNLLEADEPATKKQLWALYAITKKDYRNSGLTKGEAAELIKKLNAEKGYEGKKKVDFKKDLMNYMQKNADKLAKTIRKELDIKSVVGQDPSFWGKDAFKKGKKYPFFGGGMGFAWLEFDKRSKLAQKIYESWRQIHRAFDEWFVKKYFSAKERKYFDDIGFPLGAMMMQNLDVNATKESMVADYMEDKGVKKVQLRSRLD